VSFLLKTEGFELKGTLDDLSRTDAAAIQRLHPQPLNDTEGVGQ